jgi:hypothetical protein
MAIQIAENNVKLEERRDSAIPAQAGIEKDWRCSNSPGFPDSGE